MLRTAFITGTLLLGSQSVLAIPPESFGFPSAPNDTALTVAFPQMNGSYALVSEGELFGINVTRQQPVVALDTAGYQSLANSTAPYMVVMVDPDVPTPSNPTSRFLLHWAQPNMRLGNATTAGVPGRQLVNSSAPFVPFRNPAPPNTSDAHRYILYAFSQPANFSIPAQFRNYSDTNRSNFNLTSFVAAARLGTPLAAQYFFVSSKTGVPGNFSAAPGGSYPGGNGAQVTNGPGPSPSATSSGSATGATNTNAAIRLGSSAAPLAGLVGLASWLLL